MGFGQGAAGLRGNGTLFVVVLLLELFGGKFSRASELLLLTT